MSTSDIRRVSDGNVVPEGEAATEKASRRIAWGMACLGLAGVTFFTGYLLAGPFAGDMMNPAAFVVTFGAPTFQAGMIVNMLAMIISFFGFFALYGHLAGTAQDRSGLLALVLATVGNGLLLAVMAVPMALIPTVARMFAASPEQAVAIVAAVFTGPVVMTIFMLTSLLITLGIVVFTVGLWREGRLPKSAVCLFAVGLFLLQNAHFAGASGTVFVLDLVGGTALAIGGFWLAYAAGQLGSMQQPRVTVAAEQVTA